MKTLNAKEAIKDMYAEINMGKNVHDDMKHLSVEELYDEVQKDRFPFHVICFNLLGEANIGAIIRSAILHGAEKVWIFGRHRYDRRSTVGAHHYIDIETVDGFADPNTGEFSPEKWNELIDSNFLYPMFVEQGGIMLHNFDWVDEIHSAQVLGATPAIVMGNETNGIPDNILFKRGFPIISIPQRGVIRSFNVATAMNMVTWDMRTHMQWL
jgi:tRNA G18 (ribose-2'-O)-methylase SpoU